ncbi:cortical protein KAR9-domain-containing protein [Dichotomopilus funicola]|uniref:Cortical protein KAR9-domain-containing protein n=1 Tax=Dichotomopilus funicola TaxID=1934379 RepID=A0AAN6ZPH0_9PEZI|nr:cortical protein KAR9-domain-containing protein [Dichotomopilus funicola]
MSSLAAGPAAPGSGGDDQETRADQQDPLVVIADTDESSSAAVENRQPKDAGDHDTSSTTVVLTFSDVPHELVRLGDFESQQSHPPQQQQQQQRQDAHADTAHIHIGGRPNSSPSGQQQHRPDSQLQQYQQQQQLHNFPRLHKQISAESLTSSNPAHRVRKPSPGLAARLKALGFGSRKTSPPPPTIHLEPGRLPEEALRRLDQDHLAGSAHTVVERRGRPWKGAIARIPSLSSLRSDRSDRSQTRTEPDEPAPIPGPSPEVVVTVPKPDLLPEITATEPLEMDTHKYRLPDHTNGNGVKAQPGTRHEHIARDTRPPQAPPLTPEIPPPPLPKDTPPLTRRLTNPTNPSTPTARDSFNPDSIPFNPLGLQRAGSIYTLSRASFANQLAQLTSLQLPDADSLSNKVSAIPTAQAATTALIGAADQIRGWISKASEVIGGLESDDDVEWAAAGGREGVEEVENAIIRFEELIKVYVGAIEDLQCREDIAYVSGENLRRAVEQMEAILEEWTGMRKTLQSVKAQVEIAMEWEELWNMVLGDIQNEMDELTRLVFEMEERRHKSILTVPTGDGMDIGDLETIVEDTPRASVRLQPSNNRFSMPVFPASPTSPSPTATTPMGISQDDSSLLALFARMQPLRASLDFLPMRLSVFENRADSIFPTACEELEMRRSELDSNYSKLEKDAESLRKELGEDRWVLVFRGAGRQAQKMHESVERSVAKLREAIDTGVHLTNQPVMSKKLENYEAKKTHYGPAIERVLSIIDKGVKDRLTVNGEILRLHAEMQAKWEELKAAMAEMDVAVEELQADRKEQQLRDSVSSMVSNDMSTLASGHETPQSSPPSSVIMSSMGLSSSTHLQAPKQRSSSSLGHFPTPSSRRQSSLPTPKSQVTRKPVAARTSTLSVPNTTRDGSATPTAAHRLPRPSSSLATRPKWNASTNTTDIDTGHNFKPLSLTTPSPYAKRSPVTPATRSSGSKLPTLRTPLSRQTSTSPIPEGSPTPSRPPHASSSSSPLMSFRDRLGSPGARPSSRASSRPRLAPSQSSSATASTIASRRASLQPPGLESVESITPATSSTSVGHGAIPRRPASSMATGRRSSLLPHPRGSTAAVTPSRSSSKVSPGSGSGNGNGVITGRESPQAVAGARFAMRKGSSSSAVGGEKPRDLRPRWRG